MVPEEVNLANAECYGKRIASRMYLTKCQMSPSMPQIGAGTVTETSPFGMLFDGFKRGSVSRRVFVQRQAAVRRQHRHEH